MGTVSGANARWINSGDAWQIALRHTGELVKEQLRRIMEASHFTVCQRAQTKREEDICSENRFTLNTIGFGAV